MFVVKSCCGDDACCACKFWWNGWKCDGWGGIADAVGWSQCSPIVGHVKHDERWRRLSGGGG